MNFSVAIDGPAGAGKSTIAKLVAKEFNLMYINTGAMYRAVALKAKENNFQAVTNEIEEIQEVRKMLVKLQREMSKKFNVIMDGRDIGTVVLKDAPFKFFLTATAEERANRRFLELKSRDIPCSYDKILSDIIERDYKDSHREVDPLKKAEDAIEIDTTGLSIEEVTEKINSYIRNVIKN